MRKKTHNEFVNQLKSINPKITVLGKYMNDKEKIEVKCDICNHIWFSTPSNLLQGRGCMMCRNKNISHIKSKSTKTFISEMKKLDDNIEVIEEYKNNHTKIKCRCKKHNNIFYGLPQNLLHGQTSCTYCIKEKNHLSGLKSHQCFIEELRNINKNIDVIGIYSGANKHIKVQCKKCKHIWSPTSSSLISGYGCPHCHVSKGEEKIEDVLNKYNISFECQKRFKQLRGVGNLPLSYDFYIPHYNALIEYQGRQHQQAIDYFGGEEYHKIQICHDNRKRKYAKENGYNYLEIWYFDYDNIEDILMSYFNSITNPVTTTA